jgi:hypothetical protein
MDGGSTKAAPGSAGEEMEGHVMKKSKRSMRYLILSRLFDHLDEAYGLDWGRDSFVSGRQSLRDVDALLAFKSDPKIEELRSALDRLENGTYGVCIGCKSRISQELLDADPAHRFCLDCEQQFSHVVGTRQDLSATAIQS